MRSRGVVPLGAAVLVIAVAVGVAHDRLEWASTLLTRERNGCSLAEAVKAVSYTSAHRRLERQLRAASRVTRQTADGLSLWETPRGRYWAPTGDSGHFFVFAEVLLEPYSLPEARVRTGDVVIDCGAYLGHFTRQALDAGASQVVAVEPATRQSACLRRTFDAEIAAGRVVVVEEGVWSAAGSLVFQDEAAAGASFVEAGVATATPSASRIEVRVTTIDALVEALRLEHVDVVKMDIEGSEQEALKGAAGTLARFKPRLAIAAYHKPSDPVRLPALVRAANRGYRFVAAGCRLDLDQVRPLTFFFY